MKCHGDDTPLTFHDTPLFSLLILLVHVNKFNVHDTLITLPLRLLLLAGRCCSALNADGVHHTMRSVTLALQPAPGGSIKLALMYEMGGSRK